VITPNKIIRQVDDLVKCLVEIGLASDQNFSFRRDLPGSCIEITFRQAGHVSIAMKDRSYQDIYAQLETERVYNAKLPDGALIQMMYMFNGNVLQKHRLAFFPCPHLEEFQNDPKSYLQDEIYVDVIAKNIVSFPLRFDYNIATALHKEILHPKSHLTLGQYERCRIPVTAPLTPYIFIDFILRNFYHTTFDQFADKIPKFNDSFDESIVPSEKNVIHVQVPVEAT